MQFVGAILGGVSGIVSAVGNYQSAKAEVAAYRFNARINAADAVAARTKSDYEEKQSRKKLITLMGSQRALYAKAGVDLSSGSPLLVLANTAAEGEEEAQNIRWQGDVEVASHKNKATLNRFYANSTSKAATMQLWAGVLGAASGAAASYKGSR